MRVSRKARVCICPTPIFGCKLLKSPANEGKKKTRRLTISVVKIRILGFNLLTFKQWIVQKRING